MFGQNFSGSQNGLGSFMDFMFFNEVMNGVQKKQKSKGPEPKRSSTTEAEERDAMESETGQSGEVFSPLLAIIDKMLAIMDAALYN